MMSIGLVTMAANQSMSREVNRNSSPPWFNMSYVLTHEITDGFMNHFFISSQRKDSINAGVPSFFISHIKGEVQTHYIGELTEFQWKESTFLL